MLCCGVVSCRVVVGPCISSSADPRAPRVLFTLNSYKVLAWFWVRITMFEGPCRSTHVLSRIVCTTWVRGSGCIIGVFLTARKDVKILTAIRDGCARSHSLGMSSVNHSCGTTSMLTASTSRLSTVRPLALAAHISLGSGWILGGGGGVIR